jgi:hypothetical protein
VENVDIVKGRLAMMLMRLFAHSLAVDQVAIARVVLANREQVIALIPATMAESRLLVLRRSPPLGRPFILFTLGVVLVESIGNILSHGGI